jgi:hypothetical protein
LTAFPSITKPNVYYLTASDSAHSIQNSAQAVEKFPNENCAATIDGG